MTVSPKRFERFVAKLASTSTGDNENQTLQSQQTDAVPELLQPDEGAGSGPRGEFESMTSGAEEEHLQNREGGYLPKAFSNFNAAAKETGQELKGLLSHYGPEAIVSRATPEAGATKVGMVTISAFGDELNKIFS